MDYLLKSGFVPQNQILKESIHDYDMSLDHPKIPESTKEFMRWLLQPFSISLIKFTINLRYVEDDESIWDYGDRKEEFAHVAPSLRLLYEDKFVIPPGYHKYFVVSFPDVVEWARIGEGLKMIKTLTEKLDAEEFTTNNIIGIPLLIAIVQMYLTTTGKELECKIIN